jgi:hypothetical protein
VGCCLGVLLLGGAPRLALVLWWFMDPSRVIATFAPWSTTVGSLTAPTWAWPLAGLVLVPWTTIAYVFVSPGGLTTLEWVVLGVALLLDLSTHGGSGRAYQQRRSAA